MIYTTNCTVADGEEIQKMADDSKEITWDEFLSFVDEGEIDMLFPDTCPHIKDDYAVSFYQSVFDNAPCVFIEHSRIEYVFT